jgi:circadian clock protein KaiA
MSDYQPTNNSSAPSSSSRLYVCLFPLDEKLARSIDSFLNNELYQIRNFDLERDFIDFVRQNHNQIDCLVFSSNHTSRLLLDRLYEQEILLPVVIIERERSLNNSNLSVEEAKIFLPQEEEIEIIYHNAEVRLYPSQLEQIGSYIKFAIGKFLNLAPSCTLSNHSTQVAIDRQELDSNSLVIQQRRLAEKLKERLGYLGIFYKRNPQDFYCNLSLEQKEKLFQELSGDYRQIILNYFDDYWDINQSIDKFVNQAFFTDLSVSQILEIHMELMDEFAQHLKIEGRSEEILLDYRLALIDIIAHLCEMYRRSIPREDIPLELILGVD